MARFSVSTKFWLCWFAGASLFSLTWVGLCAYGPLAARAATTEAQLGRGGLLLKTFTRELGDTPSSLRELTAYARQAEIPFDGYDGTGQRLQYLRFNKRHYALRSFGGEATDDTGVAYLPPLPRSGLVLANKSASRTNLGLYPIALASGSSPADSPWFGQIIGNNLTGERYLVVRHRLNPNVLSVAPHDRVEEFLWLAGDGTLVFSATGSERYADGIFLWKPNAGGLTNLLSASAPGVFQETETFYLALAGVRDGGDTLAAYIAKREDSILAPEGFLNTGHLYLISVDSGAFQQPGEGPSIFDQPLNRSFPFADHAALRREHRRFRDLPLAGDVTAVLPSWEAQLEAYPRSVSTAYSMWILCSLYAEASELIRDVDPRQSEIVRAAALELGKQLRSYHPMSPQYLKGFGAYIERKMQDDQTLGYKVADLRLPAPRKSK